TVLAIFGAVGLLFFLTFPQGIPVILGQAAGASAALALALLSTLRNENRSPGGVDNGGSVALLAELARELPGVLPADVELILLSPSAEENNRLGLPNASAYLRGGARRRGSCQAG
ncbi:MAG: hypothetical protein ACE10O_05745, partial [Candidatus Acidiferrales bacterium]